MQWTWNPCEQGKVFTRAKRFQGSQHSEQWGIVSEMGSYTVWLG